ncbi:MAG: alpha/beta hydrolase-fold protein [Myxococcota bacterium]|nr:alpha/beta hydrolase-fold protein [Myxococcota bacterium]
MSGREKQGTVKQHWMDAGSLRGNPLGDPFQREIHVWSPFGVSPEESLPWVLVLPAFTSTGVAYLSRAWRKPSLPQVLDGLVSEGMRPCRVVLPDAMTAVGGSQYLDSVGIGNYATWLVEELPGFLSQHYADHTDWFATGSSSGGYGALSLAMLRPGHFRAVAAHSPDAGFETCYPPDFPVAVETIRDAGGLFAWWEDFRTRDSLKGSDHAVLGLVGMSCAYSPQPDAVPLPCRLPVDLDTGALLPEIFDIWLRHDPVRMVPHHSKSLAEISGIYLDVGRRDEFRLQVGARMVARALERHSVPLAYSEHEGGHFGLKSRLRVSIPWLVAHSK